MGYETEYIKIGVQIKKDNGPQQQYGELALADLQWMIRKSLTEIRYDYEDIQITTEGLD